MSVGEEEGDRNVPTRVSHTCTGWGEDIDSSVFEMGTGTGSSTADKGICRCLASVVCHMSSFMSSDQKGGYTQRSM